MPPIIDMAGTRIGRLVVVAFAGINRHHHAVWLCRCDCGKEIKVTRTSLHHGNTRSCGCLRKEVAAARSTTHGKTGSPEHESWTAMHARCNALPSDCKRWRGWAGRGIRVCRRWCGRNGFANFLKNMGPRPPGTSLDRKNNDGNYTPRNCRWATPKQQRLNQRR